MARMREQLADQQGTALKEQENLRRALGDKRYQHEEAIRQVNIKNEDIESQCEDLSTFDIADAKATILQLEPADDRRR